MVTYQLQVRCRPVKVRRSETNVLPLNYTANILGWRLFRIISNHHSLSLWLYDLPELSADRSLWRGLIRGTSWCIVQIMLIIVVWCYCQQSRFTPFHVSWIQTQLVDSINRRRQLLASVPSGPGLAVVDTSGLHWCNGPLPSVWSDDDDNNEYKGKYVKVVDLYSASSWEPRL